MDLSNGWILGGTIAIGLATLLGIISMTKGQIDPKLMLNLQGEKRATALSTLSQVPRNDRVVPDYEGRKINHDLSPNHNNLDLSGHSHLMKQGQDIPVYSNHSIDPVLLGKLQAAQDTSK